MEFTVKCPDCGKELKVTVEDKEVEKTEIIRKTSTPITWKEISEKIKAGKAKEFLSVGDIIPIKMKDGQTVNAVVADTELFTNVKEGDSPRVAFVIEDCLAERHSMNKMCVNKGGWRNSEMRKYLNTKIYNLLPDDPKEVIAERTIIQNIDGKKLSSTDKLWLLSATEVGHDYETDEGENRFSLFKDERSRVKQVNGETTWCWLRSPSATYDNAFCSVGASGEVGCWYYANNEYGVAFGFLV